MLLLAVVCGQPVAALPPELFLGEGTECVMACSLSGGDCCCTKDSESGLDPHDPDVPRLSRPEVLCSELCATFEDARSGHKLTLAEAGRRLAVSEAGIRLAAGAGSGHRGGHCDLSTLPRPPPAV